MQSTTDKEKVKKIFKTKKGSITCSKLIINELAGSPTRSENVLQSLLLCFVLHMPNAQAVNSVPCETQRNQSILLAFKN